MNIIKNINFSAFFLRFIIIWVFTFLLLFSYPVNVLFYLFVLFGPNGFLLPVTFLFAISILYILPFLVAFRWFWPKTKPVWKDGNRHLILTISLACILAVLLDIGSVLIVSLEGVQPIFQSFLNMLGPFFRPMVE